MSSHELLRSHEFCKGADSDFIMHLVACGPVERTWEAGRPILRSGETADRLHLLIEGDVSIGFHAPGGPPAVIQTLGPGDVLGWSWLIPPYRWAFDATAVTAVRALTIDATRLRAAMAEDPVFGHALLSRLLVSITDRLQATRLQLLDVYGPRR
jgi:CRP/FNR family cyclic AMP-dependent transcriptional regulator